MRRRMLWRTAIPAALASVLLLPAAAKAQNTDPITSPTEQAEASATPVDQPDSDTSELPVADAAAEAAIDEVVNIDDAALLSALNFDPANLAAGSPAKPLRTPGNRTPAGLAWSRADRPDGSAAYSVNKPLATPWDAKIGADVSLAAPPVTSYEPGKPLPWTVKDQGSGAAWANVSVPNLATVAVRADPSQDRSRLGTSLERSLPLGSNFSVTLQNSLAMTELYGAPAPTAASPARWQIWGSEKTVRLNILATGTTLAAGTSSSTADALSHNKLSAEQKLYGPLNVTTAVTDIGQPTSSKSITAGFKLDW